MGSQRVRHNWTTNTFTLRYLLHLILPSLLYWCLSALFNAKIQKGILVPEAPPLPWRTWPCGGEWSCLGAVSILLAECYIDKVKAACLDSIWTGQRTPKPAPTPPYEKFGELQLNSKTASCYNILLGLTVCWNNWVGRLSCSGSPTQSQTSRSMQLAVSTYC